MKKLLFFAAFAVFGLTMNAQEKITKTDVNKATDAVEKGAKVVENEAVKQYNKAKTGGFKVGLNIGLPMQEAGKIASFNIGADIAWLWEVAPNFEAGALTGFTQFFGDGSYDKIENPIEDDYNAKFASKSTTIVEHYSNESFIPIAATGRYYFNSRKMYAGLDIGYAIHVAGDAGSGFYFRPKFGWNFGKINLVGSFQRISGGVKHIYSDAYSVSGFNSANIGVEFAF